MSSDINMLGSNQIAPMLSTCILMGRGTLISMDLRSWYKTLLLISFTTSDTTTYSASVVDKITLFIPLLFHAIGTPQKNAMYPYTLILVSLLFAKSLSLSASKHHIPSAQHATPNLWYQTQILQLS